VFADVLPKPFGQFGPGKWVLPTTAASAASGCTGLLRALLADAAFFGVGIGQIERAGFESQAESQPCFQRFAGAPRRIDLTAGDAAKIEQVVDELRPERFMTKTGVD
jgi:hypothetical protein